MTNRGNEGLDRVEANLDRLAALLLNLAERQSILEQDREKTDARIEKILAAVTADGQNLRALARKAESS